MVPPASNDEKNGEREESPGVGHGTGDVTGLNSAREAKGSGMLSGDMEQFSLSNEKPVPGLRGDREADNEEEAPDVHVFTVDLHGIKKEQIKLEVPHKFWILIRVEHTIENEKKLDMWHRVQNNGDKSLREYLMLPQDAKIDQIKASMKHGMLIVTVPKGKIEIHGQPGVKSIEISD